MTTKNTQEVQEYLTNGDSIEFILQACFHYVPATTEQDEFWWRSCILEDGEMRGTQGYLMVWLNDGEITTFHTYRCPTDWAV